MPPKRRQKKDPPRSAGGASGLPGNVNDLRTYSAGLRWLMVEWHVLDGLNYEQIGRRLSTGSHRCWGTSVRAICKLLRKDNHVKPEAGGSTTTTPTWRRPEHRTWAASAASLPPR